jgi:hypothetical protein
VDSSVVGYDGARNVRDEERSVWQTKPEREQKEETEQSRWGFRGKTVWNWLELFIVPIVLFGIGLLFEMQQTDRQRATEQQQALADQRAQDEALQAYLNQMTSEAILVALSRDRLACGFGGLSCASAGTRSSSELDLLVGGRDRWTG